MNIVINSQSPIIDKNIHSINSYAISDQPFGRPLESPLFTNAPKQQSQARIFLNLRTTKLLKRDIFDFHDPTRISAWIYSSYFFPGARHCLSHLSKNIHAYGYRVYLILKYLRSQRNQCSNQFSGSLF